MTEVNGDKYPLGLASWAGHHSGGVKRLLDSDSGRPNNTLLHTNLLSRLKKWVEDYLENPYETPNIVLLVGGPGNGKTEAIETTLKYLDSQLGCDGAFVQRLSGYFVPRPGTAIPRLVRVDTKNISPDARPLIISIVQDASMREEDSLKTAPELFVDELMTACRESSHCVYLGCVNRGILDDALIWTIENHKSEAQRLLERITQSVGLSPDAPACWPLADFEKVAVWPMDIESLFVGNDDNFEAPVATLINQILQDELWHEEGTCAAGEKCPFCRNKTILSETKAKESLLRILRWYELGSGKRWTFRDIFSLFSYLFAGHLASRQGRHADPCAWAAQQVLLDNEVTVDKKKITRDNSRAIFLLATSCYQHSLFHYWDPRVAKSLYRDIQELNLTGNPTLIGLYNFLNGRKKTDTPATISESLNGLIELLDPAICSPDIEIPLSSQSDVMLRNIDIRFSRSVEDGYTFIRKYHSLFWSELELLKRLSVVDANLSSFLLNNKKSGAAHRVQCLLRDFSCRLVRRSLGVRASIVKDCNIFKIFQELVESKDDDGSLYVVAKQVEDLLNEGEHFEVYLTTTFGQPLPPPKMRATFVVPRCGVNSYQHTSEKRPHSPIPFLEIKAGGNPQYIALTYDLFKAVYELKEGLSPASLPRAVVALLDTTKARMSGAIVRDKNILERSKIKIGISGISIGRYRNGFAVSPE